MARFLVTIEVDDDTIADVDEMCEIIDQAWSDHSVKHALTFESRSPTNNGRTGLIVKVNSDSYQVGLIQP